MSLVASGVADCNRSTKLVQTWRGRLVIGFKYSVSDSIFQIETIHFRCWEDD